jgi:hypothetical protein
MNQLLVQDNVIDARGTLKAIQESQDSERKRALAKVYALLVKLADETDNRSAITEHLNAEIEPLPEQGLIQLTLL